jgi:polar amino acid transport system substrate-binding protein
MRKFLLLVLTLVLAVAAASCGGSDEPEVATLPVETGAGGTGAAAAEPDPCAPDQLELVNPGRLTIATDNPAFPPWFEGGTPEGSEWEINDPATGEGFESAVAYAVAGELGFTEDAVDWIVVPFDNAFKPGAKDFDFDINQVSVTEERDGAVDFSDSYYDVNQAVVALASGDIAGATTIAELKDAKLGAPIGTTSYDYVVETVMPSEEPAVFNTLNDAVTALGNGQVDGIVVDLPTAFFVTAVQVEDGTIVGQFPSVGGQEQFGMVFEEGNPLRDCVNEALAALRESGELDAIQQEWLADKASAPVLE